MENLHLCVMPAQAGIHWLRELDVSLHDLDEGVRLPGEYTRKQQVGALQIEIKIIARPVLDQDLFALEGHGRCNALLDLHAHAPADREQERPERSIAWSSCE